MPIVIILLLSMVSIFLCLLTKEALMQRPDDTAGALVKRLHGYHGETVPILEHYKPHGIVAKVNANQGMDGVWGEVLGALKRGGK